MIVVLIIGIIVFAIWAYSRSQKAKNPYLYEAAPQNQYVIHGSSDQTIESMTGELIFAEALLEEMIKNNMPPHHVDRKAVNDRIRVLKNKLGRI